MGECKVKTEKYSLLDLIITVTGDNITASEFIYFKKENIIREISYPAEIDKENHLLIIKKNNMRGHDTGFTLDEFIDLYSNIPRWDMTSYYQIYDNRKNKKYISSINMLLMHSRIMNDG